MDPVVLAALQKRKRHRLASGTEVVDIYGSVGGGFMIALDGRLFEWDLDFDEREVTDPILARLALVAGSKAVPELARLIPQRPARATDCARCGGSGKTGLSEQMRGLCNACGGVGWTETP